LAAILPRASREKVGTGFLQIAMRKQGFLEHDAIQIKRIML
jgi:hypothetical protein